LLLEAEPGNASGDSVAVVDDVQKVGGDRVDQPGADHAVHRGLGGVVRRRDITEDVVLQSKSTKDEEYVATPFGEVRGLKIQNNRNRIPDVLDGGGLAVQAGDGCVIGDEGGIIVFGLGVVVVGPMITGAAPESRDPLLEDEGLRALFFERIGDGADAVLGGGGGLEEFCGVQELLAALSVGGTQRGGFFFEQLGGGKGLIAELRRGGRSCRAGGVNGGGHGAAAEAARGRDAGGFGCRADGRSRGGDWAWRPSGRAREQRGRKQSRGEERRGEVRTLISLLIPYWKAKGLRLLNDNLSTGVTYIGE
jgi:hypothetical protein